MTMTYFPMGTIDASHFNSTKYPGICKPMDKDTLDQVVAMQQQLNRLAQLKAIPKIAPDGDVGPATVALVNKMKEVVLDLTTDTSTCLAVAMNADVIASNAQMAADAAGVPSSVSAPTPPKPPSYVLPSGTTVTPPSSSAASISDAFGGMSTTTLLLLGVGVVGVGYMVANKRKGKRS
jgi:hypothetical protein